MTDPAAQATSIAASRAAAGRSSLRARMRIYAGLGLLVVGAWLYFTINAVTGLYDATVEIGRYTDLQQRVSDATRALGEASESLDRFARDGEGYDLAQHYAGRTELRTSLGTIRQQPLTEGTRGLIRRAESGAQVYGSAADRTIALRAQDVGEALRARDLEVGSAAVKLGESLDSLEIAFARSRAIEEQQLLERREAATAALVILAALILGGLFWLIADVNRRILAPCAAAARALGDLAGNRAVPTLFDGSRDELGELGRNFNETARLYAEREKALEARDIEASVNAVLAAAATINDLAGYGSRLLDKVVQVTGASSAVLYVSDGGGGFAAAASIGGAGGGESGRESARRAAQEGKPILVSAGPETPTIDLYDGRILPRESIHLPLLYFGEAAGVLALGSVEPFTERARNTLAAIAPSLAVALANALANERLAEQSRRLSEQNELLEEQRSRISRTAQELQRASALKDRFLAAVSHELRTPMTVILGFTGTLLRGTQGKLNDAQSESLERVQRNARLLLGLINDVLDISKIESGRAEVRRELVSVETLLEQARTDFAEAARKKGLALQVSTASGLENVISDPAKLAQILSNLLANALKFTDSGSVDVLAESRGPTRWALVVSDSGVGIPLEEQEAVFEEFRQGEAAGRDARGGTGLGLAIVRKLAILLGGEVSLVSAPGKGSTFTVTLPRELPGAELEPAGAAPAPARPGRLALIVDDDESTRKLLRLELEPHGFRVIEAADGQAAITIAEVEKPDAIVMDVLMPKLDGWGALKMLKESAQTRSIPVVIHSVVDDRPFGFALGAFDCLVKPVAPGRLVHVLARAGVAKFPGLVMIVDDDAHMRQLLAGELSGAGFQVAAVEGGAEALARLEIERPAAILLDLMMPEPDGFEVLYRIRRDPRLRDIPVVVMTGKELTAADYARLSGSARKILQKGDDMMHLVRDALRGISAGTAA